jgi:hypothetical protein
MPTGRHRKTKKGGFLGFGESTTNSNEPTSDMFGSIGSTLSGWGSSLSNTASSALNKTKNAYSSATGSPSYAPSYAPTYTQPTTSYVEPRPPYVQPTPTYKPSYISSFGGKNKSRKRSRKMRGGYGDNIALTGLAASAAPISDIKSSQPLNIVGGKRKTKKCRRNRRAKSCKRGRR